MLYTRRPLARFVLRANPGDAPPREAILRPLSETEAEVELLSAEEGVSAGQACVFYDPDSSRIFGGGWIWRG